MLAEWLQYAAMWPAVAPGEQHPEAMRVSTCQQLYACSLPKFVDTILNLTQEYMETVGLN
jgi:hypothetical protein